MQISSPALHRFSILVFLFTLVYGILREHIFLLRAWSDLPLYTLNKALAWTALNHIGLAFLAGAYRFFKEGRYRNYIFVSSWLMNTGLLLLSGHLIISLLLLSLNYYTGAGSLSLTQSLSLLLGIMGFVLLLFYLMRAHNPGFIHIAGDWSQTIFFPTVLLLFILAHVFLWGIPTWFTNMSDAAYMPQISFMAILDGTAVLALLFFLTVKIRQFYKNDLE